MKSSALLLLAGLLLLFSGMVHAEGECPPGMFATNPPGTQGPINCAPIPSYAQNQGQQTAPQTPQPPPERWQDHWGAIATDADNGILGTSINTLSQNQAELTALNDCQAKGGIRCKIQLSYRNQCAAMIVGGNNKIFNTNPGANIKQAVQTGMIMCGKAASDCHAFYTACSLPVRIQ